MKTNVSKLLKKEPVFLCAALLALLSAFFVRPDAAYFSYIDYRTLAVLFCLMAVMAEYKELLVFDRLARRLLSCVRTVRQLLLVLIMLCFFSSMLITNDVALITFVPLTISILHMLGEEWKRKWLIPIVVMQTVAANLGSMLTPIGNPQNLYLYGKSQMRLPQFILEMLPYTAASFLLLLLFIWVLTGREAKALALEQREEEQKKAGRKLWVNTALFVLCLLAVGKILSYLIVFFAVTGVMLLLNRAVLKKVDYSLLLTFVCFFIFIGNMGRIPAFYELLQSLITGREVLLSIASSQIISNVPAALLLSGFTENIRELLIGTNLGGLGTLIASMASLISFKYFAGEAPAQKGRYLLYFTAVNLLFLAVLAGLYLLLA